MPERLLALPISNLSTTIPLTRKNVSDMSIISISPREVSKIVMIPTYRQNLMWLTLLNKLYVLTSL